jgi:hypothetical protein
VTRASYSRVVRPAYFPQRALPVGAAQVTVAKVDATIAQELSSSVFSIAGYPTLLLIQARDHAADDDSRRANLGCTRVHVALSPPPFAAACVLL